ncbi:MAG: hypothetical protein RL326_2036 [Pseudomonadota bacterium]
MNDMLASDRTFPPQYSPFSTTRSTGGAAERRTSAERPANQDRRSTAEEVIALGQKLHALALKRPPPSDLPGHLEASRELATLLPEFISAMNRLPPPSPGRSAEANALLIPFAIASWRREAPTDPNELRAWEQYKKVHDESASYLSDWQRTVLRLIDLKQVGSDFPAARDYVDVSLAVEDKRDRLRRSAEDKEARVEELAKMNEAARNNDKDPVYLDQENLARAQLRALEAQIDALLADVIDVSFEHLPQASQALHITVTPRPEVLQALTATEERLEKIVIQAMVAAQGKEPRPLHISSPNIPTAKGDSYERALAIPAKDLATLWSNGEALSQALDTLRQIRAGLHEVTDCVERNKQTSKTPLRSPRAYLGAPIVRLDPKYQIVLRKLIEHPSESVRRSTAALLRPAICVEPEQNRWGHLLQDPHSAPLLFAAVSRVIASTGAERKAFESLLSESPSLRDSFVKPLLKCADCADKRDFSGLCATLSAWLEKAHQSPANTALSLGLISTLRHFALDNNFALALRYQIPDLKRVSALGQSIAEQSSSGAASNVRAIVARETREIVNAFSDSLRDYYVGERGADLREFVENLRYFFEHRDALRGLKGNEAIQNSIALIGPPGVGKTYFMQCFANELGLEIFVLSPGTKRPDEDTLAYTHRLFEKVKEHKEPCILMIDEAESSVVDRNRPNVTASEAALTNYILTAVEELRREHPHVVVIVATNYIERVDDALIRPGRIDLELHLERPSQGERKLLLENAMRQERLPLALTDEQLQTLLDLSEGFIPVQLRQVIFTTNRILLPRLRETDESVELTFDLLKRQVESFKRRNDESNRRLQAKGSPFARPAE